MITTVALGTNSSLYPGADPWTAFSNITCAEGDLLILSSVSRGAINNVSWRGYPFTIGVISAGLSDACIVYLFVTALMAGTGDVVITKSNLSRVVALRKVTGVSAFDVSGWQNGDPYGSDPSSPAVQANYTNEFYVGVMGASWTYSYFTPGTWQQGWTRGQLNGTVDFTLDEGYKIATSPQVSQAKIIGQSACNYWMCHVAFRACA